MFFEKIYQEKKDPPTGLELKCQFLNKIIPAVKPDSIPFY
jgi:hypothetical protein